MHIRNPVKYNFKNMDRAQNPPITTVAKKILRILYI